MNTLTAAQLALYEFRHEDENFLALAARDSPSKEASSAYHADHVGWVKRLQQPGSRRSIRIAYAKCVTCLIDVRRFPCECDAPGPDGGVLATHSLDRTRAYLSRGI